MTSPDSIGDVSSTDLKAETSLLEPGTSSKNLPGGLTLGTTIGSMSELKSKAPDIYKAIMQGIAWNICEQLHKAETEREQIEKDNRPY